MNTPKAPSPRADVSADKAVIDLTDPIRLDIEDDLPIIDLTERVFVSIDDRASVQDAGAVADDSGGKPFGFEDEIQDDLYAPDDDFVDSLGLEIFSASEMNEPLAETSSAADDATPSPDDTSHQIRQTDDVPSESPALTAQKLESALERVIEKLYAEKIEGILVETIEQVVTREIERIKTVLTGERDIDDER